MTATAIPPRNGEVAAHGADGGVPGDPRATQPGTEAGVMPVVRLPRAGLPFWVFIVGAVGAGLLLFSVLDARRRAASVPAVAPRLSETQALGSPVPTLFIPPEPPPAPVAVVAEAPPPPPPPPPAPPPPPRIVYVPQPAAPVTEPVKPARVSIEAALVIDNGGGATAVTTGGRGGQQGPQGGPPQAQTQVGAASASVAAGERARSGVFANRSTTVVQGTLVQAVLETALDSTRPGFARAVVSKDVRGFDGTKVLIPRGSKLIGEYNSQVAQGQKRALVTWNRLIRPDGVTMAISSPSADTLGGGGIPAKVDSHFWERFGGSILQSVLNIGVNVGSALATKAVDNTIVILPNGSSQTIGAAPQIVQPGQVTPTLTVKNGTSISVFVARDLDFTAAEVRP